MADIIELTFVANTKPLDEVITKTNRIEKEIRDLAVAYQKGRITIDQYNNKVKLLATRLQKATGGSIQARNAVNAYSASVFQAAKANGDLIREAGGANSVMQQTARRTNQLGVVFQQVGYQVGDFAVQVQSGTNYMVALGQQMTQLVGVGAMLSKSTKWIAAFSALGIIVPIATAIAAAFMRTAESMDEAAKSAKELNKRLKEVDATLKEWNQTKAAAAAGVTVEELFLVKGVEQAERELQKVQERVELLRSIASGSKRRFMTQKEFMELTMGMTLPEAEAALQEAETRLAELRAMERQKAREKAEQEMNAAWEQQKRDQALAEYEAGQAAIAAREDWVEEAIGIFRDAQERMRNEEIAETERSLERLFRNRTVLYSIRFAGEETVMNQPVLQPPKAPKMPSYEELLAMGWTEADIEAMGVKKPRSKSGGVAKTTGIGSLAQSLLTEQEQVEMWREESLVKLQEFNAKELKILGGHAEAKRKIEEEYANRVQDIRAAERTETLSVYSGLFGSLATLMGSEGKKLLKIQAGISAAATMINSYEAASKAAAKASNPAQAFAVWAAFVAKGVAAVAQIKALGSGGSVGSSASGAAATAPTAQAPAQPQRVIIDGLDRDSLISGEQLQNIFDKIYEENEDRGFVFQVAR